VLRAVIVRTSLRRVLHTWQRAKYQEIRRSVVGIASHTAGGVGPIAETFEVQREDIVTIDCVKQGAWLSRYCSRLLIRPNTSMNSSQRRYIAIWEENIRMIPKAPQVGS